MPCYHSGICIDCVPNLTKCPYENCGRQLMEPNHTKWDRVIISFLKHGDFKNLTKYAHGLRWLTWNEDIATLIYKVPSNSKQIEFQLEFIKFMFGSIEPGITIFQLKKEIAAFYGNDTIVDYLICEKKAGLNDLLYFAIMGNQFSTTKLILERRPYSKFIYASNNIWLLACLIGNEIIVKMIRSTMLPMYNYDKEELKKLIENPPKSLAHLKKENSMKCFEILTN